MMLIDLILRFLLSTFFIPSLVLVSILTVVLIVISSLIWKQPQTKNIATFQVSSNIKLIK